MKHSSFWLEETEGDQLDAPRLAGKERAKTTIIGGGYVGLWTALRLKELDPSHDVVVLEMNTCGSGASGRNGGFALSWWPKIVSLIELCGEAEGIRIARESVEAISDIKTFSDLHRFDIEFKNGGWLWTATSTAQRGAWRQLLQTCKRVGQSPFELLSNEDVQRRSGSKAHLEGIFDRSAATLHPAKLARGLRKVALERGVRIYENTRVLKFSRTDPIHVMTEIGEIITENLVIANNAWAANIKELARSIVAITSDMIVTEPAEEDLKKMGWIGNEAITDSQTMVDYYHVTKGHRIAFGKGGWGIAFGGNIGADFDCNPSRAKMVESDFRRYYPELHHVRITHDWCGPIDRTPNSLPLLGRFKENPSIIYGVGWSGNGVGPSVVGGKILASMILHRSDRWGTHPLIGKSVGLFPPEPIRYIGAHLVRAAVAAKEAAEIENRTPSWLAAQIAKLAPKGLEDKDD